MTGPFRLPRPPARATHRLVGWCQALLAVGIVAVLLGLAAANVLRARWSEVEDGVLWADQAGGPVAAEVSPGSPAAQAGIVPGDVLLAVDGQPVASVAALVDILHAGSEGTELGYTVLRLDRQQLHELTLQPIPGGKPRVYPVLAGIGILTLLIGAAVRLRSPGHQATLHFFWLTAAFFGVFAFSFSGRLDTLDWVFFWADEVSILLLAPLFMHFALVFPERPPGAVRRRIGKWLFAAIYTPALVLGLAEVAALAGSAASQQSMRTVELIWQLEIAYLAACVIGGLAIMIRALHRAPTVTARRQLRWVVSGAVLGGGPFVLGYALPWSLGFGMERLQLTAIALVLMPLAFASAIVRYRLRDVEVIVKRGLVYTVAVAAMAAIYLILESLATDVFLDGADQPSSIVALLATLVVVLLARPVRDGIQTALDRVYYRDRYDYRRALVNFARDLNSDLNLGRQAAKLVTRVSETLVVDQMVLLQGSNGGRQSQDAFRPVEWAGFETEPPALRSGADIERLLREHRTVALDDPAVRERLDPGEAAAWRRRGIYYFVPCVAQEKTIAVMALGRRESGEPLSSDDMALLAAVAGQVATAMENGRLYGRLQRKAAELDQMHQFSQSIIKSLSDGLLAVDLDGRVIFWNAALERSYGVAHADAVGKTLDTLFDAPAVERLRHNSAGMPTACYRVPILSRHAGGRRRLLVNLAAAPLLTQGGETSGMIVIIEDITERVQLEEQLQMSEKMASVGLLAAGVAHEVNTPLTGISSYTQMLLDDADPADPRTGVLKKIERQTFRAAKIVNGLLNLARPGRSDATTRVDLNSVVNEVLAQIEPQLAAASVKVRRELVAVPVLVQGVEFKLQQVFLNLFLNARDAMPNGGWLTVCTRVGDGEAVVEVADTGSGIAPNILPRIYDPFFTTKEMGKGIGLGLSVTYGVVREHHGVITCESEPERGTRFTLTLPRVARRDRSAAAS